VTVRTAKILGPYIQPEARAEGDDGRVLGPGATGIGAGTGTGAGGAAGTTAAAASETTGGGATAETGSTGAGGGTRGARAGAKREAATGAATIAGPRPAAADYQSVRRQRRRRTFLVLCRGSTLETPTILSYDLTLPKMTLQLIITLVRLGFRIRIGRGGGVAITPGSYAT